MVKMKTLAATGLLAGLVGLSACAGKDAQVNYAKGIMAAQTTYNTLAAPMPDVMNGKMPGVPSLTHDQKELIKASSRAVRTLLDKDVADIAAGKTVTQDALDTAIQALSSYETCWTSIIAAAGKVDAQNAEACGIISTPSTTPTTTTTNTTNGN